MHWEQLIVGHELYTQNAGPKYRYLSLPEFPSLPALNNGVAGQLVSFMNSWGTRSQMSATDLFRALKPVYKEMLQLKPLHLENLRLKRQLAGGTSVEGAMIRVFDAVAGCSKRNEQTGASKILHVIFPDLFVMWDMRIAAGYGVYRSGAKGMPATDYVVKFIPRVQTELDEALWTYSQDNACSRRQAAAGIRRLSGGSTLAKLVDEFNYSKFTLSADALWRRRGKGD